MSVPSSPEISRSNSPTGSRIKIVAERKAMLRNNKFKGGGRKAEGGKCAPCFPLPPSPFPPRTAITLIEVLISMFVLLFGLMGVAAIFPVASHYVLEGDKRDRSSGLAQIAFEELKSRKLLRPNQWFYTDHPEDYSFNTWIIERSIPTKIGQFSQSPAANNNPGHAFVLDPLGGAEISAGFGRVFFPISAGAVTRPWPNLMFPTLTGTYVTPGSSSPWPIRRVTAPIPNPNPSMAAMSPFVAMDKNTAETAFRLRDDLVTQQPEAGDRPSVQRWRQNGGQLLSREYVGDYSWLATVVPTRNTALMGLQPSANIKDEFYEVTSVVFYKRDITPSATVAGSAGSERLIGAEFLNSGELALYKQPSDTSDETVDTAVDGIKPTNWIAVCGVNQITGAFMMKWYKILAMDDETDVVQLASSNPQGRYLMVDGPEWPSGSYTNLRAVILPGAIDAYTRVMQIEQE
jgi:hypothetical protein